MTYHTVYLAYEEGPDGRNYVGKHSTDNPYDLYLGSCSDPSFSPVGKIILGVYKSAKAALQAEIQWQRSLNVVTDLSFANQAYQSSTGFDVTGRPHTPLTLEKMSKPKTESHRKNMRLSKLGSLNPNYGRSWTCSDEHKRKVSEALTGVPLSNEHVEKVKKSRAKRWMCLVTGIVSDKSGITRVQKKRGICTSLKKEVQWQEFLMSNLTHQTMEASRDISGISLTKVRAKSTR
jgi:hypothetical protein